MCINVKLDEKIVLFCFLIIHKVNLQNCKEQCHDLKVYKEGKTVRGKQEDKQSYFSKYLLNSILKGKKSSSKGGWHLYASTKQEA